VHALDKVIDFGPCRVMDLLRRHDLEESSELGQFYTREFVIQQDRLPTLDGSYPSRGVSRSPKDMVFGHGEAPVL